MQTYQHLGAFSDWPWAGKTGLFVPTAMPGPETQQHVRQVLGFGLGTEQPLAVASEGNWERDGVAGEAVSWSVGYGPRTRAWVLKPAGASGPLPGIVALHDHGGFKYYGKEKIADGPADPEPAITAFRNSAYAGRAYANALAREGFVVLVHDTFLWGSRRFAFETMPEHTRSMAESCCTQGELSPDPILVYNTAAALHEHLVEKYCMLLGTTLSGVISYEDRVATNYLASRVDVCAERIGCLGLSGGGLRSALLQATCERIRAAVIVGLMSTYEHLLDHNVASHTWMLYPSGWARYGDWPDLAACRAPSPLLVQYDLDDSLFTVEGMRAADQRLAQHYRSVGAPENYTGQFYPGPHKFDLEMQQAAFAWLRAHLQA